MKKIKFIACILAIISVAGIFTGCFRKNIKVETELFSKFEIEDEINEAFINSDMIICLVNNNELRVYSDEGDLLENDVFDTKATHLRICDEGLYCVEFKNGDYRFFYCKKSDPIMWRFTTNFDEKVIDISSNELQSSETDVFWFLTSDHELYAAGLNVNQSITDDEPEKAVINEPVKIMDDVKGICGYKALTEEGEGIDLITDSELHDKFVFHGDEMYSYNDDYTAYKCLNSLSKRDDEIDTLVVGNGSVLYELDGDFYYSGYVYNSQGGKANTVVSDTTIDIPDKYNYSIAVKGRVLCYDDNTFKIYELSREK